MIDGITVLSKSDIMTISGSQTLGAICSVLLIIAFVLFVITDVLNNKDNKYKSKTSETMFTVSCSSFLLVSALFIVFTVVYVITIKEKPTGTYEYKVLIDEGVYFSDVCEKYEVVDSDGDTYIIRER